MTAVTAWVTAATAWVIAVTAWVTAVITWVTAWVTAVTAWVMAVTAWVTAVTAWVATVVTLVTAVMVWVTADHARHAVTKWNGDASAWPHHIWQQAFVFPVRHHWLQSQVPFFLPVKRFLFCLQLLPHCLLHYALSSQSDTTGSSHRSLLPCLSSPFDFAYHCCPTPSCRLMLGLPSQPLLAPVTGVFSLAFQAFLTLPIIAAHSLFPVALGQIPSRF